MFKLIVISAVSSLLCTAIVDILEILFWDEFEIRLQWIAKNIAYFIIRFIWTSLFMYLSCKPFTMTIALIWMWVPETLICFTIVFRWIMYIYDYDSCYDYDYDYLIVHGVIELVFFGIWILSYFFSSFIITQEIVSVHDVILDQEMSNSESTDKVLEQFEYAIGNDSSKLKFSVEKSGVRVINNKKVLVYHVSSEDNEKYISGFIVQVDGKTPIIIPKKIYYDKSLKFGKDALRTVRKKYQTEIIGEHMFAVDEEYNSYEIFVYRENLFFSNGNDYGIIILNLNDGTSEKYSESTGEVPKWVDFESTYPKGKLF